MKKTIYNTINQLKENQQGATLPFFALAFSLLILITGFAVDYGRAQMVKDRLQSALDTAALAGAREGGLSSDKNAKAEVKKAAYRYFKANFPDGFMGTQGIKEADFIVNSTNEDTIDGANGYRFNINSVQVNSYFMQIFGKDTMPVNVEAVVNSGLPQNLQVAIALDVSGSMQWKLGVGNACDNAPCGLQSMATGAASRIGKAKVALNGLLNDLVGDTTYISIVPWNARVNLGRATTKYSAQAEACVAGNGAVNTGNAASGCTYVAANDVTNNAPHPQMLHMIKNSGAGKATLTNYINALKVGGNTDSSTGMMWGYQQFSTSAGVGTKWANNNYSTASVPASTSKFLILMTDGANTRSYQSPCGGTEEGQPECVGAIYSYEGGKVGLQADAKMLEFCNKAKKDKITVAVIMYDYKPLKKDPYYNCASDTTYVFEDVKTETELAAVFKTLAKRMVTSRLTK